MKRREEVGTLSTDIILADEAIRTQMSALYELAKQKNYLKSYFFSAFDEFWRAEARKDAKKNCEALTEEQIKYRKKIEAFIDYYRDALIYMVVDEYNNHGHKYKVSDVRVDLFEENMIILLVSMYLIYVNDKENITQATVANTAKKYFAHTSWYYVSINQIKSFFRSHLDYVHRNEEGKPQFTEKFVNYQDKIYYDNEFLKFANQYSYKTNSGNEAVLMLVWIIDKFF